MKFLQKVRVEAATSKLAFAAATFGLFIAAIAPAWVLDRAVADSGAITISGSVKPKAGPVSTNAAVVDENGKLMLKAVSRAAKQSDAKDTDCEPEAADVDSVLLVGASQRKEEFSSRMSLIRPLFCKP